MSETTKLINSVNCCLDDTRDEPAVVIWVGDWTARVLTMEAAATLGDMLTLIADRHNAGKGRKQ